MEICSFPYLSNFFFDYFIPSILVYIYYIIQVYLGSTVILYKLFQFFCWTYQPKYVNYLFNLFRSLLYFQILCYTLCAPCYNVHLMRSRSFITLLCINNNAHQKVGVQSVEKPIIIKATQWNISPTPLKSFSVPTRH